MYVFLTVLAILVCAFLILIVLIQEPKGGGLSSTFGASNQIMGVKRTGDFLEQATWGLAIALLVICLGMKVFSPGKNIEESAIQSQIDHSTSAPAPLPPANGAQKSSPAAVPATNPGAANTAPSKK